jgi:hypothetical protein
MMIAIHQPEFMPWLGFFHKMGNADRYVVFDHVQFKKRYFENRNRIKQGDEATWVSLPVISKGRYLQPINEVETDNSSPWQRKLWEKIRHAYGKTQYFPVYAGEIEEIISGRAYERLVDFNLAFIEWFRKVLDIRAPMVFSSTLGVEGFKASELILQICLRMGAHRYLCGPSGKDYLQIENFRRSGIEIEWQHFEHPMYPQKGKEFIPYLSTIDLVCNCGPHSREILFGALSHQGGR